MVTSDFRVFGEVDRGNYFPETDRIIIFLSSHETLDDLISTITHEHLHYCINQTGEIMDDDQEERIIYIMSWADEYLA
jgi:uncharacterized protein YjaZ